MTNYPVYVWVLELAGVVGLPAVTAVGLYQATARVASRGAARAVAGLFAVAWSAWIVTCAILADRGAFEQSANQTRPWIGVAAGGSLVLLLLATAIPLVRRAFATTRSLAALTWPQSIRVVGVVFLVAFAMGRLPAVFALPAGLGDLAVGIAAPFIARRLARGDRSGAFWFNVLGLTDLVVAVSLGFLAGLQPHRILAVSPSTVDLGLLPLVLIPTAAVPLAAALHLASLPRLRRSESAAAEPARATA
jgi:hypothetical protein